MSLTEAICAVSTPPEDRQQWGDWLEAGDAIAFLTANEQDDEFVVHATPGFTFIHAVLAPALRVTPPDVDDLLSWSLSIQGSWGISYSPSDLLSIALEGPLESSGTKSLQGGQQLVFPRSFEGRIGEKSYWELLQPFAHAMELHFIEERKAYCRLDENGDLEEFVRFIEFPEQARMSRGLAIIFRRDLLEEWMLLTDTVLVRLFDFTRCPAGFVNWSRGEEKIVRVADDFCYRLVKSGGTASYARGYQIVRPQLTRAALLKRLAGPREEERQYVSFIAHDWKNGVIREISCAPGATANYFTKSDLPFETSPAFFRPEVLQKYKADSEKYRLEERSVSCRGAWHLKTYDINEGGQVHSYIVYLGRLPYAEQLHWKAYNEYPKAPLSERAIASDFEGRWHQEYDALRSLKGVLGELHRQRVPWWVLPSEQVMDRVHYPVTPSVDEWANEILNLEQLVVEGFRETWLRRALESRGVVPDPRHRSLKLVESWLMLLGYEQEHAREITAVLHQVHELRSKVKGHVAGEEATALRKVARSRLRSRFGGCQRTTESTKSGLRCRLVTASSTLSAGCESPGRAT